MRHRCPDGTTNKLTRHGPVGTTVGVYYTCPNCDYRETADKIRTDIERVLNDPAVRAALR